MFKPSAVSSYQPLQTWFPDPSTAPRECCYHLYTTFINIYNLDIFLHFSLFLFQQACAVVIGIRWFFFISAFVWMFIETLLLFMFVKNASQTRSNQHERFKWKFVNLFGYLIPLVVVIVCTLVFPQDINEEWVCIWAVETIAHFHHNA